MQKPEHIFDQTACKGLWPIVHTISFMRPCVSCYSGILCCFYCKLRFTRLMCVRGFLVLISCCGKISCKTKTVLDKMKMKNQILILKEFIELITCL